MPKYISTLIILILSYSTVIHSENVLSQKELNKINKQALKSLKKKENLDAVDSLIETNKRNPGNDLFQLLAKNYPILKDSEKIVLNIAIDSIIKNNEERPKISPILDYLAKDLIISTNEELKEIIALSFIDLNNDFGYSNLKLLFCNGDAISRRIALDMFTVNAQKGSKYLVKDLFECTTEAQYEAISFIENNKQVEFLGDIIAFGNIGKNDTIRLKAYEAIYSLSSDAEPNTLLALLDTTPEEYTKYVQKAILRSLNKYSDSEQFRAIQSYITDNKPTNIYLYLPLLLILEKQENKSFVNKLIAELDAKANSKFISECMKWNLIGKLLEESTRSAIE